MRAVCIAFLPALSFASMAMPRAMSGMEGADVCVQDQHSCALELMQRRAVMHGGHDENSSKVIDQHESAFHSNTTEDPKTEGKLAPIDWYDPVGEDEDEEEKEMREKGYVDEDGDREEEYVDESEDEDAEEEDYDDDNEDSNPYDKTAEEKAQERKEEEAHWEDDNDIDLENREDFEMDPPFAGPVSDRLKIYTGYGEDATAAWSPWTEEREKESLYFPKAESEVQATMLERPREQDAHAEAEPRPHVAMIKDTRRQLTGLKNPDISTDWFYWKTFAGFKKGGKLISHKASTGEKRPVVFFFKTAIAQWVLKRLIPQTIDWVAGYSMCAHPRCKRGRNKRRCCWSVRYTKMFVLWLRENGEDLRIDRNRISLMGYSGGAVIAASAAKELGGDNIKGAILLNGGLNTMSGSVTPLPSYLCIMGTKDFPKWLARDRKMYKQLQTMEGYEDVLELEGIDHFNWPLKQETVLEKMKGFLLTYV